MRPEFLEPAEAALQHVMEWVELHRSELSEDWELSRRGSPLRAIEPLE
jgi:hypothetical protein